MPKPLPAGQSPLQYQNIRGCLGTRRCDEGKRKIISKAEWEKRNSSGALRGWEINDPEDRRCGYLGIPPEYCKIVSHYHGKNNAIPARRPHQHQAIPTAPKREDTQRQRRRTYLHPTSETPQPHRHLVSTTAGLAGDHDHDLITSTCRSFAPHATALGPIGRHFSAHRSFEPFQGRQSLYSRLGGDGGVNQQTTFRNIGWSETR